MSTNVPLIFQDRQSSDGRRSPWGTILGAFVGVGLGVAGFLIGVGAAGLAGETTSFWFLSRSAGMIAYLLLWGSIVWGLLLSSKIGHEALAAPILLDAHQFVGNVAIGFSAFHGLVLMGDRYFSFPLLAVLAPFAGDYKPVLVAGGQLGFWLSLALSISFLVRKRLGPKVWRQFHYVSFLAFWAVFFHSLLIGTDSKFVAVQLFYMLSGSVVIFLTLYRIFTARRSVPKALAKPAAN